jgi:hypothetical protein
MREAGAFALSGMHSRALEGRLIGLCDGWDLLFLRSSWWPAAATSSRLPALATVAPDRLPRLARPVAPARPAPLRRAAVITAARLLLGDVLERVARPLLWEAWLPVASLLPVEARRAAANRLRVEARRAAANRLRVEARRAAAQRLRVGAEVPERLPAQAERHPGAVALAVAAALVVAVALAVAAVRLSAAPAAPHRPVAAAGSHRLGAARARCPGRSARPLTIARCIRTAANAQPIPRMSPWATAIWRAPKSPASSWVSPSSLSRARPVTAAWGSTAAARTRCATRPSRIAGQAEWRA